MTSDVPAWIFDIRPAQQVGPLLEAHLGWRLVDPHCCQHLFREVGGAGEGKAEGCGDVYLVFAEQVEEGWHHGVVLGQGDDQPQAEANDPAGRTPVIGSENLGNSLDTNSG